MNRLRITSAAAGAMAIALVGAGVAQAGGDQDAPRAKPDSYQVRAGQTLTAYGKNDSLLKNDSGHPLTLVGNTSPAHGTLSLNPDGTFSYTPEAGFTGTDSFTYTVTDAVLKYDTKLPPLDTIGGVKISGGSFGSAIYPVPGKKGQFYGLTDRGPNVDGPNGTKVEPMPSFTPAIGRFKLKDDGTATLEETILLRAADGTPYNGLVSTEADTGETITDLNGNVLPKDPNGYDPEGLVALRDGTFWVSDEYGPYITHFDASGRQIGRLSPFDDTLPAELKNRMPNRGMEGLTLTPDGTTLVGMMQSALQQKDLAGARPVRIAPLRIVTHDLKTGVTHQYLYLLDNPATNAGASSEITALSNTQFLVTERDGNFAPNAVKKIFLIDLAGATEVGPGHTVPGATYDAAKGGLLLGGKTIEAAVGESPTAAAAATLAAAGITPVGKSLYLDFSGMIKTLNPNGYFFGQDKIEGVATLDGGKTLVISNDSDFGINGLTTTTAPFQLKAKILPNGRQDDGSFLVVDLEKLTGTYTATGTVTITVKK
ncbi:esterase-like activity of phytase family protein [Frankia sp. CNm7]|uniref:Esterase-like activity of phytase family protein n=1 Tax=Frankia nepalensis TaxID=1836974 RepID=A0A937RGG2_9ACTN|nr:esterase-like activity of phytase family protein [Frankia nepalensis]MBL7497828.1 esterase-like activity of phytase family protein [Frankia nepalensis]MBL7515887.1 esterase-like activity of phytase family protein [Frankia nepalensis]MBL7519800.1 esterase-like activity of phytase family protein [Frankia nepalensis]MBL7631728.1 esterase-like activity of phytase family protein [Frankia nepalensis]